jgi:transposase
MSKEKINQFIGKKKQVFKPYSQDNLQLPPLDNLISENHQVRIVNEVINNLDLSKFYESYKGGGSSAYDPQMLMKTLVYGYSVKVYSSRKLEQALKQDITFIWLSGMQYPDHKTINNFRTNLKPFIDEVFSEVIQYLMDKKLINLDTYFVDGTKLEANANKHTAVWSKNTQRYKEAVQAKIKELLKQIEMVNELEPEPAPMTAEDAQKRIEEVREHLAKLGKKKQV